MAMRSGHILGLDKTTIHAIEGLVKMEFSLRETRVNILTEPDVHHT